MRPMMLALGLALVAICPRAWAAPTANPTPEPAVKPDLAHRPEATENVDADHVPDGARPTSEIWSYFSAGLLLNVWNKPSIDAAEVRDGRVRVLKRSQFSTGVGLQAYYPVATWTLLRSPDLLPIGDPSKQWLRHSEFGIGPYVGVSLDTDEVIDTIGVGLAFSVRRREGGLRFGLGVAFDPDARHLASDFKENGPVPVNTTDIKYVEEMAVAGQIMVSFTPGFDD